MINYHKGVKFDDFPIGNTGKVYLLDVTEPAIPRPITENNKTIGYEDVVLIVSIGINAYRDERKLLLDQVMNAVVGANKLQFLDEDTYRDIVNIQGIEKTYSEPFLTLDITLQCSPYKYVDEIEKPLQANLTNNGTYNAHTLLKVSGNATINGMSVSGAPSAVYINSEDKTAYTLSGSVKVNALQYITGENFLVLRPGANTISFTGNIQINYRHTYLW